MNFADWLAQLDDVTDAEGALTIDQLKEILRSVDRMTHVGYEYRALKNACLDTLLDRLARLTDGEELWEKNPIILIMQDEEGNFMGWVTNESHTNDDPPSQTDLYELTHNMTEETVELYAHHRDCQCSRCDSTCGPQTGA